MTFFLGIIAWFRSIPERLAINFVTWLFKHESVQQEVVDLICDDDGIANMVKAIASEIEPSVDVGDVEGLEKYVDDFTDEKLNDFERNFEVRSEDIKDLYDEIEGWFSDNSEDVIDHALFENKKAMAKLSELIDERITQNDQPIAIEEPKPKVSEIDKHLLSPEVLTKLMASGGWQRKPTCWREVGEDIPEEVFTKLMFYQAKDLGIEHNIAGTFTTIPAYTVFLVRRQNGLYLVNTEGCTYARYVRFIGNYNQGRNRD